jgi:hypothetical protein
MDAPPPKNGAANSLLPRRVLTSTNLHNSVVSVEDTIKLSPTTALLYLLGRSPRSQDA